MNPVLAFFLGSIGLFFIVAAVKAWQVADAIMESLKREDEQRRLP